MSNTYVLTLNSNNSLTVALDWGCNMYSWKCNGDEIMYLPADYPQAAWKITGGGNPLLFPSVGRTYDCSGSEPILGRYTIYGDDSCYDMTTHGFLYGCTWEVVSECREGDKTSVTFRAIISNDIRRNRYPFDVGFEQTYMLFTDRVELLSKLINTSNKSAPAAFGYHPYFQISNIAREGVRVELPVQRHLFVTELTQLSGESEPTDGKIDLEKDVYYDHGYDTLHGSRMTVTDTQAGRTVHVEFDPKFEMLFLYSPDGSPFVCLEPWTKGMGAFASLKDPTWENGEKIPVIKPGEQVEYKATFSVEKVFH